MCSWSSIFKKIVIVAIETIDRCSTVGVLKQDYRGFDE